MQDAWKILFKTRSVTQWNDLFSIKETQQSMTLRQVDICPLYSDLFSYLHAVDRHLYDMSKNSINALLQEGYPPASNTRKDAVDIKGNERADFLRQGISYRPLAYVWERRESYGPLANVWHWVHRRAGLGEGLVISEFQSQVVHLLRGMGILCVEEWQEPLPGLFFDVWMPEKGIVLEIDGPYHFAKDTRIPLGSTVLKRRQARQIGLTLCELPYWDWEMLETDDEKRQYLDALLDGA